jgi:hypothetical protein
MNFIPPSSETFKAVPVGFADGTLEGWLGAGTQVAADLAAPDREAALRPFDKPPW